MVAHFHYVIVGGILFAFFGAFYYWFPKMSGKMYSETLGKLHFWLFLIGFHLTFDFMHIPGLLGMPRRIYTYEPGRGWDIWNFIVTIGVAFRLPAILVFVGQFDLVLFPRPSGGKRSVGRLDARVVHRIRRLLRITLRASRSVKSRRPLWDLKHPEDPDWKYEQ